ncbi:MAG TPA: helix-turn-helix transcriptional regulator [Kineosporiaceae bacterium]
MARHPPRGTVSGYVLKLTRKSTGLTQEALAERLDVTRASIQGWESSRRPLGALSAHSSLALRHQLASLGASPVLVNLLGVAIDADYHLAQIIRAAEDVTARRAHPLGRVVLTHTITELITWPVTGVPPRVLASQRPESSPTRHGPVPGSPVLAADQREAFFAGLCQIADHACSRDAAQLSILAHRQACYLTSLDATGTSTASIRTPRGSRCAPSTWTPHWADARSQAVALARRGDPEPLRAFIEAGAESPDVELANLNYHAYWVGEIPGHQHSDTFMIEDGLVWRGTRLLRHLTERLAVDRGFIDLNIHILWLLLTSRPGLCHDDPATARSLAQQSETLLDENGLSPRSRRELSSVLFSLRSMGMTA